MKSKKLNYLVLLLLLYGCSAAIPLPTTSTPESTTSPQPTATEIVQVAESPTATVQTFEVCTVSTGAPQGYLNLRSGAGVDYPVLRVLNEGETLTIMQRGAWLEVLDASGVGYVNSNYCK